MGEHVIDDRYRLVSPLGRGGMSEVWAADDLELGRRVALKLLAPDADRARFEREARAAASLAHPHINQLYDYGVAEGRPYMVLEYLPGGTLEETLRRGEPLADADAERIAAELASALAHAHERGLVHRDLKPANVLFDGEGRAKIADFGIARLGHGGTLTEAGTVLGTAAYISPEQAAGETAGPASDVYSFGVLLFRMLSGRLPFESEQPLELVALHRDAVPPPLESFRPDAPAALAALTAAALAKDPADRPPDGRALATALGVPASPPAGTSGVVPPSDADATQVLAPGRPPAPPSPRRRRAAAAGATLALLAAGGVAAALAVAHDGGTGGAALTSTGAPTTPTRSLPKLTTAATIAAVAPAATTTTTGTTTRARPATTASAPTVAATTVAPPPPPTTTAAPPPDTTTAPPPTTDTTPTVGTTTAAAAP